VQLLTSMIQDFPRIFVPLFVVIDPAGMIPVYLALTSRYSVAERRQIARRACLVAACTAIIFVVLGQAILTFLGLSFADFQIAGGILLVVLAITDLLMTGKPAVEGTPVNPSAGVGVVPLAVPLIVGPATMTTSLLLVNTYAKKYESMGMSYSQPFAALGVCVALLINLAFLLWVMWYSDRLVALVGKNTLAVVNKIVMILIAGIAVSLIRQGITSIVTDLQRVAPTTQVAP